jgi:CheY-like chemotaxis protein
MCSDDPTASLRGEVRATAEAIAGATDVLRSLRGHLSEGEVDQLVEQIGRRAAVLQHLADPVGVRAGASAAAAGHDVVLYVEDHQLVADLVEFVVAGLAAGEGVVVVATPAHRRALDGALAALDVHLPAVRHLDAATTLASISRDGVPDRSAFTTVVQPLLRQQLAAHGAVRVYGEMVALLWDDGRPQDALALEQMWDEVGRVLPFRLLCGYRTPAEADASDAFAGVCRVHRGVNRLAG